jgi:hypothetical protein
MEICLALFVHIARTIQHLFFDCHLVKFIWRIVHVCFIKLSLPTSIDHLFNDWLFGINRKLKSHILPGATAFVGQFGNPEIMLYLTKA